MRIPVIPVHSVGNLAKTEHSHPLGMVVSTHFRCGKGVKRGLKNGALPFSTLWNLNYGADVVKDSFRVVKEANDDVKDVVKRKVNVTKEFTKAQRQIYKLISRMPQISAAQMSEYMGISLRQVQRYFKQLSDQNLIVREGGRKNGVWKILDDEYEGFFNRI